LTITEDNIIPTSPKLYGERFPIFLIGAPIKNQSKKLLNIIPSYVYYLLFKKEFFTYKEYVDIWRICNGIDSVF